MSKYFSIIFLFAACASEPKQDYPDHEQKIREIDSLMTLLSIAKFKYDSAIAVPCDTVYLRDTIYKSVIRDVENLHIGDRN